MTLIVEDGSGKSNADSYASVAMADEYHTKYTGSAVWFSQTETNKERFLRQATQYIDSQYRLRWKGVRSYETQALAWPRSGVVDHDGYTVDENTIPQNLIYATAYLALEAVAGPLLVTVDTPGKIKKTKEKVAVIEEEVEYFPSGAGQQKYYAEADKLLDDYLTGSNFVDIFRT